MKRVFDATAPDLCISEMLQGEFQRALYCERRAESNLDVHDTMYKLARDRAQGECAYNTLVHALVYELRSPTLPMHSRYEPRYIIRLSYWFLKKKVGRDVAKVIVNMAFAPFPHELIEAARSLMRRTHTIQKSEYVRFTEGLVWGDALIYRILLNQ